jgi:protein O-GlcNAc transferase
MNATQLTPPHAEVNNLFTQAKQAHSAGQLQQAGHLYRQVLALSPAHADCYHLLGGVGLQTGNYAMAADMFRRAIACESNVAVFHYNLASALAALGDYANAMDACREALRIKPNFLEAHCDLAALLYHTEDFEQAVHHFEQTLAIQPDLPEVHSSLGFAYQTLKQPQKALFHCQRSVQLNPDSADAFVNLGGVLELQGEVQEAITNYQQALRVDTQHAKAHYNLGQALLNNREYASAAVHLENFLNAHAEDPLARLALARAQQSLGSADAANANISLALAADAGNAVQLYKIGGVLLELGRYSDAQEKFAASVALDPSYLPARLNLGVALLKLGRHSDARTEFATIVAIDPNDVSARLNLITEDLKDGDFESGMAHCQIVLAQEPLNARAMSHMSMALLLSARAEEAVSYLQQACLLEPQSTAFRTALLLALIYAKGSSGDDILREHVVFEKLTGVSTPTVWTPPAASAARRRLRVGYVSGDFREHPVAYLVQRVFARHSREVVEVFAYYNSLEEDAMTLRLKAQVDHWRDIMLMSDEAVANLIQQDQIDILVDLSGHTGNNRLTVFARKPAPIQVEWLGYPSTTGLSAMDYRLTDAHAEPVGMTERYSIEKLWRLPDTFCCYEPCATRPERVHSPELAVRPTPALRNGYVTYGCFNNLAKVGRPVIALWSQLLLASPDSRLMLEASGLEKKFLRNQVIREFAAHGIGVERLTLIGRKPEQQYVLYNEIDIALDPFPCNGGNTSLDTLWMGVPIVTLAGTTFVSRMGVSLLSNLGLQHLIANSHQEYVDVALRLASDWTQLNKLRMELRPRMQASPLMNEAAFVRNLEAAYAGMWNTWCNTR